MSLLEQSCLCLLAFYSRALLDLANSSTSAVKYDFRQQPLLTSINHVQYNCCCVQTLEREVSIQQVQHKRPPAAEPVMLTKTSSLAN